MPTWKNAKHGVDLRILLPQKSSLHMADFARVAHLRDMQDAICQVLFFQHGMILAKTWIIDDSSGRSQRN